jgi:hypothetical protein
VPKRVVVALRAAGHDVARGVEGWRGRVLLRIVDRSAAALAVRCLAALAAREHWHGVFAVIENDRIRVRDLSWTGRAPARVRRRGGR